MNIKLLSIFLLLTSANFGFAMSASLRDNPEAYFLLWDNNTTSLFNSNTRGLGGGLEYQVSENFCHNIKKNFIEDLSCDEVMTELSAGLRQWENIHPAIRFRRLPMQMPARIHPENLAYAQYKYRELGLIKASQSPPMDSDYQLHGGEIDFFTIDATTPDKKVAFIAYADLIWGENEVHNLLGNKVPNRQIMSVDIFINIDPKICLIKKFSKKSELLIPKRCQMVLPLSYVIAHEVGHALALEHIKENPSLMGSANALHSQYDVSEVDIYHLKRLYPLIEKDFEIRNGYEDEFWDENEHDY